MKLKVSQRPEAFFDLFEESGANLVAATDQLRDMLHDYTDVEMKARRIAEREHDGDEVTHAIIRLLNTTFITPMDREDIYQLATALDDVMDAVEAAADLFVLHRIGEPLPEMKAQADVLHRAAEQTDQALRAFRKLRRDDLEPYWVEINRLENEGTSCTAVPSPTCSQATIERWTSCDGRKSSRRSKRRSTDSRTSRT